MKKYFTFFLALCDVLGIGILFCYQFSFLFENNPNVNINTFVGLVVIRWILVALFFKIYTYQNTRESVVHFSLFFKAYLLSAVLTAVHIDSAFSNRVFFSKTMLIHFTVYYVLFGVFSSLMRLVFFLLRRKRRGKRKQPINTLILGKSKFTDRLITDTAFAENAGIKGIVSLVENRNRRLTPTRIQAAKKLFGIRKIENVLICENVMQNQRMDEVLHIASQYMIRVFLIPDLKNVDVVHSTLLSYNGIPVVKPVNEPLEKPENRLIKRIFDIFFSLMVIILVLSWLTPIIALIIKLQDGGPVFFKQKRSGYLNNEFNCLKFRSMKINKVADTQMAQKNDSRVTKFGKFLRKSSIDELPQFFNVLWGEMSICGPRPHMVSQTGEYSDEVMKYMMRHFVKPGITGWAQVMGARGEIHTKEDMERRVEKDIWYVQNWSFFLDIKIIFLTVFNIIKGDKQAY